MEKKKRKKRQQLAEAAKISMKLCLKFVKKYLTFKENCRNADTKWEEKRQRLAEAETLCMTLNNC
jgi:hypothetical protein